MSNLSTRILVAVVAIPLILTVSFAGGVYFFLLMALISAFALHEYYLLVRTKGISPQVITGLLLGFCINVVFLHRRAQHALPEFLSRFEIAIPFPSMGQAFLILFLLFVPLIFLVELFRKKEQPIANIATTIFGACYVSVGIGALIGLREVFSPGDFPIYRYFGIASISPPAEIMEILHRWGGMTIGVIFAAIWICDSAAYFTGRALGSRLLFPRVSPKKTWEGAIAGFVAAVAVFLVAREFSLPYLSVWSALVCGCIVGVFGQIGDLAESLLKRDAGVKDSSGIIPGHGGALDRFDSLIFVSPLLFFYIDFILFT